TGFEKEMPRAVRDLAASVSLEEVSVTRICRMTLPANVRAGCYLQGVNEATHGIADSLLSLLAVRSEEIVSDLLAHQQAHKRVSAPVPVRSGAERGIENGNPQPVPGRAEAGQGPQGPAADAVARPERP